MNKIENIRFLSDKVRICKIEESIIENILLEGCNIVEDDVYKLKEINQRMADGKPYVVIVIPEPFSQITREARELIASEKNAVNTIAKAIVVKSLAHKLIADFYLAVNKPVIKTRIFNTREAGLLWLKEQLNSFR